MKTQETCFNIWAFWLSLSIMVSMAHSGVATPEPGEAELCQRLDTQLNIHAVDWQPNGDWIVFAREGDGPGNTVYLWKVRADGRGLQRLTSSGLAETPRWSPDGSKIAFVKANRAWLINSDGTGLRALGANQVVHAVMAWSPEGSRIALVVERGDEPSCIVICDATTGEEICVLGSGVDGDWHPSGRYLVTSSTSSWVDTEMYPHILEIATGTKHKTQLTSGAFDDYQPRYSADGQWVYFYSYRGGDGTRGYLCRVSRAGGEPEILTQLPDVGEGFALSPDGQYIVFINGFATDLNICRIDGTGLRKLTNFYPDDQAKANSPLKAVKAPASQGKASSAHKAKPANKQKQKKSSGVPLSKP